MPNIQTIQQINVPRETHEEVADLFEAHRNELEPYADELLWWNKRVNLISRSIDRNELLLHIEHCLYPIALKLVNLLPLIDTGTGGGLPGIPLAICLSDTPVILNDIVKKKLMAAQQIARKLGLNNVDINHITISNLKISVPHILVSKHAFKIPDLLGYIQNKPIPKIILYKGEDWKKEIQDLGDQKSLSGRAFKLDTHHSNSFYQGKVILELNISPAHEQRRASS